MTDYSPKIIYIAGYGRSGSTLLDSMLSRFENIFGGGELTNFFAELEKDSQCACGNRIGRCSFWSQVCDGIQLPVDPGQQTRRAERLLGRRQVDGYIVLWRDLLNRVQSQSDCDYIVDSSKVSRLAFRRPILLRVAGFDIVLVHLIRRPEGVVASLRKGSNRALEGDVSGSVRHSWLKGVIGWFAANLLVERLVRRYGFKRIMLRYEDLVEDPYGSISRLQGEIGNVEFVSALDSIREDHGVSGNRMRRQGELQVKKESQENDDLTLLQNIAVRLMTKWGVSQGYWND